MKKPTDFACCLSEFLTGNLAGTRNLSSNKIKSYRDVYKLFIEYMEIRFSKKADKIMIKNPKK